MQYKTELHAHTKESSTCGDLSASEVAERYVEAGYTTVLVTNHYNSYNLDLAGERWEDRIAHHLLGYRKMKEYAKGRLCVLLGTELRFEGCDNDFLILGLDETFLTEHPNLHLMNLKSFINLAHENGLLVFQAHPFRNAMQITPPHWLDGIEVFNGHSGHDSRNDVALTWARKYGLRRISGTDFHHPHQSPAGGIITDFPIRSERQLVEVIQSGNYQLICSGPAALRDGMQNMSPLN